MSPDYIDDIELGEVDIFEIDQSMERILADTGYAATKQRNLYPELRTMLPDLLDLFMTTHRSMRQLIKLEDDDPLLAADAMSIGREQVEKLYIVALLLENPKYWVTQYLRNNWKAMYEHLLLEREDYKGITRAEHFIYEYAPKALDMMRHWPTKSSKRGYTVIVSDRAKRAVKFNFDHDYPKAKLWPKYFPREKFDRYFLFPTPGRSMRFVTNPQIYNLLKRWYKEYQFYCGYSHVHADKMQMQFYSKYKHHRIVKKATVLRTKQVERVLFSSATAVASVCTMILPLLHPDFGVGSQIRIFWGFLDKRSLFSRLIWKRYASKLMP
jgi:hypothetical protein